MSDERDTVDVKLLGLGLDDAEGHVRVTKGKDFHLVGGSETTHAKMQDTAMEVQHQLDKRGLSLRDCDAGEFDAIAQAAGLKKRR